MVPKVLYEMYEFLFLLMLLIEIPGKHWGLSIQKLENQTFMQ
jgi:hypothetical protein